MLSIRLTRIGKKKRPEYRFIICEKARDPWGKALEILGHYNPHTNPATINLKKERVEYWIANGAQCTPTVWNLLVDQGVVTGEKKKNTKLTKKRQQAIAKKQAETKKEAPAPAPAPKEEPAPAPKEDVPAPAPEVKEEAPAAAPEAEKPAEAPAE